MKRSLVARVLRWPVLLGCVLLCVPQSASAQSCDGQCAEAEGVPQGVLLHAGAAHALGVDALSDGRSVELNLPVVSLGVAAQWLAAPSSVVRGQLTLVAGTDAERQRALLGLLDLTLRYVDLSQWFVGLGPVVGLGWLRAVETDAPHVAHTITRGWIGGRADFGLALSGSELALELLVAGGLGGAEDEAAWLVSLGVRFSTEL